VRLNFHFIEFNLRGSLPCVIYVKEPFKCSYHKLNSPNNEVGMWTKLITLSSLVKYKVPPRIHLLHGFLKQYPLGDPDNPLLEGIFGHLFNEQSFQQTISSGTVGNAMDMNYKSLYLGMCARYKNFRIQTLLQKIKII